MTDASRAPESTRRRFHLAYLAVALAALGLTAAAIFWPHSVGAPERPSAAFAARRSIPSGRWGRAASYDGVMFVTLGPAADRRRRKEFAFARDELVGAGITFSNDNDKKLLALEGQPMVRCRNHRPGD